MPAERIAPDSSPCRPPSPGGAPDAIVPIGSPTDTESTLTVLVAFVANLLIAVAKSIAAMLTGSASLVAEAARSWEDTGNEILLIVANKRSRRPTCS